MIADLSDYILITGKTVTDPSGEEGQRIEFFLKAASDTIEQLCNRTFDIEAHEEVVKGSKAFELYLNNYPIVSVSKIEVYGENEEEIDITDIKIFGEEGYIYNPVKFNAKYYKISHEAGYVSIPHNLIYICVLLADSLISKKITQYSSESLGDYSYSIKTQIEQNQELSNTIEQFKNYKIY